jgi:hypothetical protein
MVGTWFGHRRTGPAAVGLVLWGAGAGLFSHTAHAQKATVAARLPAVARIELAPPAKEKLLAGEALPLQATAYDAAGNVLPTARLGFKVTPPTLGKVTRGVFTARTAGTATVVATSGRVLSNPIQLTLNAVGRIQVTPGGPLQIHAGDSVVFQAQAFDVAGAPLPNDDYPNCPLVWKATGGGVINARGALATRRTGRHGVYALAGRVKSNAVSVLVRRRQESASTRVFLSGQPVSGAQSVGVSIARIEVMSEADIAARTGNWQTLLTGEQIDALVGQPIDVQRLNNLRILIGTAFLPQGDYLRARFTFRTGPGANYVILADGTRTELSWESPEAHVVEQPCYLNVWPGGMMNAVLELILPRSIVQATESTVLVFEPHFDWNLLSDDELKVPFGSVVGQLELREGIALVFASTPDDGYSALRNYFGSFDPETGQFRISSLPAGTYELGVIVKGQNDPVMLGTFTAVPGQDTLLPGPIPVP